MSSARARANHALYLARIVVASWREVLAREEVAAATVAQAFHGGACDHLADAYGWFLLEIVGSATLPDRPPRCCDELPAMEQGRAIPAEIGEFRQLESRGWLGDMLAGRESSAPAKRQQSSLALASSTLPNPDQVEQWSQQLEALFDRMGDFLDES